MNEIELKKFALEIRRGIVWAVSSKGGGHVGGSLDLAELLSVLYNETMNVRPDDPNWDERDYLVCSKGHAGPAIYATLALKGFFSYDTLKTLNKGGTKLPGHCDRKVPGVDATTGSLGQGMSIASGIALGRKIAGTEQRVYCIVGDGELDEGQNWEAALFAAHQKLGNLTVFLDWNKKQIDGTNDKVLSLGDIEGKFSSFGWNTTLVDGHDVTSIKNAIEATKKDKDMPSFIILDTKKGFGVPCIENLPDNHCIGLPMVLATKAFGELDNEVSKLGVEVK